MQVLTAYGEQRDLAHEFLILTASISSIEKIEVFYIRRKLDDAAQLAIMYNKLRKLKRAKKKT